MKIMVLYAQAGGGHKKAAEAIAAKGHEAGHEVVLVDCLQVVSQAADRLVCGSYRLMAQYLPQAFGFLYHSANKERGLSQLAPQINGALSSRLLPVIQRERPEVIVSTYHFATEMVSTLKARGLVSSPLVCVITDYGLHRAWLAPRVDAYVTACEDLTEQLVEAGAPRSRVHTLGIPVGADFARCRDKEALKRELGLLPGQPVVLLMAGSFGVEGVMTMYRAAVALDGEFQLVVIIGRNQALYQAFRQEIAASGKPTKLVSFTQRVADYMHAAELLVTKPGGLTVSEALAVGLPMVVFDAIPGQEEDNGGFLIRHGMALNAASDAQAAEAIGLLMQSPGRLAAMREACLRHDKGDAAGALIGLCQALAVQA